MESTRRLWLSQCIGIAALAEVAAAQQHAHEAVQSATPPAFQTLDRAEAAEIDAITSQIVPSTDGPGAHEAGVIYFIAPGVGLPITRRINVAAAGEQQALE